MHTIQKKICLLGDFAVGKTSLVRRFVEDRFDDSYLSTIGVKVSRKTVPYVAHQLTFLIWDLAGDGRFSQMDSSYLRGASGAIIVCDLTRPRTLDAIDHYAHLLRTLNPAAGIVFAGNKFDLETERQVQEEEVTTVAQAYGAHCLPTSAKTGLNVETAFRILGNEVMKIS